MSRGFLSDREVRKSNLVDIEAVVRRETDRAYLLFDGKTEAWVPKSLVEPDVGSNHSIFTMPEWLASERGLI